jgi:hypothetical protein
MEDAPPQLTLFGRTIIWVMGLVAVILLLMWIFPQPEGSHTGTYTKQQSTEPVPEQPATASTPSGGISDDTCFAMANITEMIGELRDKGAQPSRVVRVIATSLDRNDRRLHDVNHKRSVEVAKDMVHKVYFDWANVTPDQLRSNAIGLCK